MCYPFSIIIKCIRFEWLLGSVQVRKMCCGGVPEEVNEDLPDYYYVEAGPRVIYYDYLLESDVSLGF
ncbi:Uncharacterized protein TCM_035824 [Theobroma cacao]|uniref:Uncharacterized protein n=1 Tax=Theobroma cacao TaxID=3641 RepID=A0A061FIH9_THECC|nr:Uncharacterized protein TCM_035824 [Theobroma cacao]